MKVVKIILVIVAILVLGVAIYGSMAPKTMSCDKSIVMNASIEAIHEEVADLNNWHAWSPWSKLDTAMVTTIEGEGLNQKMSWVSENPEVGSGTQEVIELNDDHSIRMELNFGYQPNYAGWYFEDLGGDSTRVRWTLEETELDFFGRVMVKMMDGQSKLNTSYEEGLKNLKEIAQAKPKTPKFEIQVDEKDEMHYVGKTVDVTMEDLSGGRVHGAAYGEIMNFLMGQEIEMSGMPLCFVNEYREDGMNLTLAVPVAAAVDNAPEGLVSGMSEGGKVVYGIHYGKYEDVGPAWEALEKHIQSNNLEVRGIPYEEYLNDPTTVQSEDEIMTAIVFPIN